MDDIISTLGQAEKDHLMAVMSRDRRLRERDMERVLKLKLELVREKRAGVLIAEEKHKRNYKSRCARCLAPLSIPEKLNRADSRCRICKHLVCSRCRVQKWMKNSNETLVTSTPPEEDVRRSRRRGATINLPLCVKTSVSHPLFTSTPRKPTSPDGKTAKEISPHQLFKDEAEHHNIHDGSIISGCSTDASQPGFVAANHIKTEKSHLPIPVPRQTLTNSRSAPESLSSYKNRKRDVQSPQYEKNHRFPSHNVPTDTASKNDEKRNAEQAQEKSQDSETESEGRAICNDIDISNPFFEDVCQESIAERTTNPFSDTYMSSSSGEYKKTSMSDRHNPDKEYLDRLNPFLQPTSSSDDSGPQRSAPVPPSTSIIIPTTPGRLVPKPGAAPGENVCFSPITNSRSTEDVQKLRSYTTDHEVARHFLNMAGVKSLSKKNNLIKTSTPRSPRNGKPNNSIELLDSKQNRRFASISSKEYLSSVLFPVKRKVKVDNFSEGGSWRSKPYLRQRSFSDETSSWWRRSLRLKRQKAPIQEETTYSDTAITESQTHVEPCETRSEIPTLSGKTLNGVQETNASEGSEENSGKTSDVEDQMQTDAKFPCREDTSMLTGFEPQKEFDILTTKKPKNLNGNLSSTSEDHDVLKFPPLRQNSETSSEADVKSFYSESVTDGSKIVDNKQLSEEEYFSDESGFTSDSSGLSHSGVLSSDAIAGDMEDNDVIDPKRLIVTSTVKIMLGRNRSSSVKFKKSKRLKKKKRRRKHKRKKQSCLPGEENANIFPLGNKADVSMDGASPLLAIKMPLRTATLSVASPEDKDGDAKLLSSTTVSMIPVEVEEDQSKKKTVPAPTLSKAFLSLFSSKPEPEGIWICRVCDKTIDVKKKTGDWFHKAATPACLVFKRSLFESPEEITRPRSVTFNCRDNESITPLPNSLNTTLLDQKPPVNPSTKYSKPTLLLNPFTPVGRTQLHEKRLRANSDIKSRSKTNMFPNASPSVRRRRAHTMQPEIFCTDDPQRYARWTKKMSKKTVSEALHKSLQKYVEEPSTPENETPKFKKKAPKVSKGGDPCFPATIKDGPKDCTVFRGNPISLCCALGGTGPLKVVWRKGRNEIKHSSQCNIETSKNMSALTIRSSQRDDSGCYTLQLMNAAGVDQYSVSVKVVDAPDPPGKPFAEMSANNSAVVSWYGSGYDGGSSITSYVLEMTKLQDSNQKERKRWTQAASTKSTSHTVSKLEKNAAYMFRVSARNQYGLSKPGPASDIVRNLVIVQNGAESSDEEDGDFVKYGPVAIKHNEKFSAKYETREKLGQGRFGKVHRVVDRATGKQYAAKIMRALKAKDKEAVNLEIEIMNHLRHPKLVQLIDAYNQGREVTMVMDLVAGGELFERVIDEDFELTEAACIKYMRQICAGVRFMHDSSILHLDLKPENIMCINKTGTQIKLIDFGLARKFNPKEPIRVMFGTPEFVAPEVINYETIGFQTDMWSVGVICYILLSGLSPFSGDVDSETLSNITAAQWDFEDEAFDQISDDAKDFISHLLVHSLKSRFTVEGALGHKWLKNDIKKMSRSKLDTRNLKRFLARRKWQKTGNAVRALGRLAALARLGPTNSSNIGQQRESGFLSSLKAQLVREKDEEMEPEKRIPEFIEPFDDIEVIEGSAARFQCIIVGKPDPEIMWYKDGQPLKETRHFRISYTEDDVCSLLITEATEADEAEYTCKAINSEGETTHNAELIVITPGV